MYYFDIEESFSSQDEQVCRWMLENFKKHSWEFSFYEENRASTFNDYKTIYYRYKLRDVPYEDIVKLKLVFPFLDIRTMDT